MSSVKDSVNPIVLIQLLMEYGLYKGNNEKRTFTFTRNNRLHVHKETDVETLRRKSILHSDTVQTACESVRNVLKETLRGRIDGKVWIDPKMKNIAVPLQMSTSSSGYGVLPTGSRIDIPDGKIVRLFTYWEKVNDIDLSAFALDRNGKQHEFSWRNMWNRQGEDITFSGDQTSGYNGGSEYFDIDLNQFCKNHPEYRYIIVCDNIYTSGMTFDECECKAGFMIRDNDIRKVPQWKGEREVKSESSEIFDPKTVQTSFKIDSKSDFSYMFAIDLATMEMIWLNLSRSDSVHIAGLSDMSFLDRYMNIVDIFNVYDLYSMAGRLVQDPMEADILVTDSVSFQGSEVIHSWDTEKMFKLLSA